MVSIETLKKNYQFRTVYNKGVSKANKFLVIYKLRNSKNILRLGVSVSKKVGNSVIRHLITRRLKEIIRLLEKEEKIKPGKDLAIIVRVSAKDASFWDLYESVSFLCRKLQI